MPLVQERVTLTLAGSLGMKSFWTVTVPVRSELTMVQVPTLRRAAQVPEEL